jgi:hemolysin activation/secretion protein
VKYLLLRPHAVTLMPAAWLLIGSSLTAHAAAPTPDSGAILNQVQPVLPPPPSPNGTGLSIERDNSAATPATAPFMVRALLITGNDKISTLTLHALVADAEGKTLTLADLERLADRITDYYQSHGYPLARAIIPAQSIHDGAVQIRVIEARYGKVSLSNHSLVTDPLLQATLAPLQGGQVIAGAPLDHALLLLSDIPGVAVGATLQPGEAVGSSDLLVATSAPAAVTATVAADNFGNHYTGSARIGGTVNFIDPLRHGDSLSVSALSSGANMNYGRADYQAVLNGAGTALGGAYSALDYRLGDTLGHLDSHGTAGVASVWAKQPLVRSRDFNLYGQLQFDHLELHDDIGASAIRTDRHLDNGTLNLLGDARDALLGGGINTWSVGWTGGHLGFDDAAAQLADARSARTEGGFTKWNANFARLQRVSASDSVYIALSGQKAQGNLDTAEKMTLGGPYTVRAYEMGALSGDTGFLATLELRHDLFTVANSQWQAIAFIDSAHISVNQSTWEAGSNNATLSGAGAALDWSGPYRWHARVSIATPIGATPELVGSTTSTRVWGEIGKSF